MRSLLSIAASPIGVQALGYLVRALGVILLGRVLSDEALGVYGQATALIAILSVTSPHTSYVQRYQPGHGNRPAPMVSQAMSMDLVAVVTVGVLLVGLSPLIASTMSEVPAPLLTTVAALFIAASIVTMLRVWIQSTGGHLKATVVSTAVGAGWAPVAALVWALRGELQVGDVLVLQAAVAVAIMVGLWKSGPWTDVVHTLRRPRRIWSFEVAAFAAPLAILAAATMIQSWLDRLILANYIDLANLGRYSLLYMLLNVGFGLGQLVGRIASVEAAAIMTTGNLRDATALVDRAAFFAGLASVAVGGGLLGGAGLIGDLVNKAQPFPSRSVIAVSAIGVALLSSRNVFQQHFRLLNRTDLALRTELPALAIYLLILVPMSRAWGLLGAAFALTCSGSVGIALQVLRRRQLVNAHPTGA